MAKTATKTKTKTPSKSRRTKSRNRKQITTRQTKKEKKKARKHALAVLEQLESDEDDVIILPEKDNKKWSWTKARYDTLIRLFCSLKLDWTKDSPEMKTQERQQLCEAIGWKSSDFPVTQQRIYNKLIALKKIAHEARNNAIKALREQSVEKNNDEDGLDQAILSEQEWVNYKGWPASMGYDTRKIFFNYVSKSPIYNFSKITSFGVEKHVSKPFGETKFEELVAESRLTAKLKGKSRTVKSEKVTIKEEKLASIKEFNNNMKELVACRKLELTSKKVVSKDTKWLQKKIHELDEMLRSKILTREEHKNARSTALEEYSKSI